MNQWCEAQVEKVENTRWMLCYIMHKHKAHSYSQLLTEKMEKEVSGSIIFADDVVLCGGNAIDMTASRILAKSAGRKGNESQ